MIFFSNAITIRQKRATLFTGLLLLGTCQLAVAQPTPCYVVPGGIQSFDGTSDYSTNSYDESMARPSVTGQISMSAWISPNQTDTPQIVFKREGAYQLQVNASDDPRFSFNVWTSNGVRGLVSDVCVDTLRWQHVAGTYDGTNWRLYHNGRPVGSLVRSEGPPASGTNRLASQFIPDPNTILLWHLNETSGSVAIDSATPVLDGDNHGTISTGLAWTAGKIGSALNSPANGTGHASAALGPGLFTTQATMDAWIRPTAVDTGSAGASYLMGWSGSGTEYSFIRLHSGTSIGVGFRVTDGGSVHWAEGSFSVPVNLLDGTWRHIAGTYSNGIVRLYLDGSVVGSVITGYGTGWTLKQPSAFIAAGGPPWNPSGSSGGRYIGDIDEVRLSNVARADFTAMGPAPLLVGANIGAEGPEMFFGGSLSEMRLYDVALTSAQVAALAANQPASLPAPTGSTTHTQTVNGATIALEVGNGLRLNQLGDSISSAGGRLFVINVNGSPISSDRVAVRQGEITTLSDGWQIPFNLPENQGTGTLEFSPGNGPGLVGAKLFLTNAGPSGEWQVAFPCLEGMILNGVTPSNVEFFYPYQDGWVGRGEYDMKGGYGNVASLPVVAAWSTNGPGIAVQGRDTNFHYCILRVRNANSDSSPLERYFNYDDVENKFRITKAGATLARYSLPFTLAANESWSTPASVIQLFAGTNKFKDVLSSYRQWARSTWWTHNGAPANLRDRFVSVPHWQNNNGNWWGSHAEKYQDAHQAHPTFEWAYWWDHEESISCGDGPYMLTQGNYGFEPAWGGAPAYAADIARCRAAGVSTLFYLQARIVWKQSQVGLTRKTDWGWMQAPGVYNQDWTGETVGGCTGNYWSMCPQATGWHEYLRDACQAALQASDADGVRLDTASEYLVCYNPSHPHTDTLHGVSSFLETVRGGVEAAGPDKYMMVEVIGSDAAARHVHGSLAQGQNAGNPLTQQMDRYGILPFRFMFPEVKIFEWGDQSTDGNYHRASRRMLFNGVGTTRGTGVPAYVAELFHIGEVLRGMGDVLASLDCEPLYPTMKVGLLANRFSLEGREVYTLWNQSGAQVSGQLLRMPGPSGRRFVNMITGRAVPTTRNVSEDILAISIPNDEVVAISVFPEKLIQTTRGTNSQTFYVEGGQGLSLQAVDAATDQVLVSGGDRITVEDSLLPGRTIVVRAVRDGYLVHDSVEADPYYPHEYTPDANTVVLWHFNEGSGSSSLDAASPILDGNNIGALFGPAVSWTGGKFGGGLTFLGGTGGGQPGRVGYVTTPINGSLFTATRQVTMAAWVRPTRVNPTFGFNYIMGWSGPDTAGAFLRFSSANSLGFGVRVKTAGGTYQWAEVSYTLPFSFFDGIWRNVSGTFNDGVLTLRINGAEVASNNSGYKSASGFSIIPPTSFEIGGAFDDPADTRLNYAGDIDDVRLMNTLPGPLPPPPSPPPSAEYRPDSRTVLLWHLDEHTGSGAADMAWPLLDGVNNGIIVPDVTWTTGRFNAGLNAPSGGVGYVSTSLGPGLFGTKATMEAWIQPTAVDARGGGSSYVMGWSGSGTEYSFIRLYSGTAVGVGFRVTNGGSAYWAEADFALPVNLFNAWNHIAGTLNDGVVSLFLNGTLVGSYDSGYGPGWVLMQPSSFVAAGGPAWDPTGSAGGRYIGDIDEVRLSNIARTDFSSDSVLPSVAIKKSGGNVFITYQGVLQSSLSAEGPYADIAGAASPYTTNTVHTQIFFRSRVP